MTTVLYVSQPTEMSGAEHSLLDLLEHLPPEITPIAASPPGRMHEALSAAGVHVEKIAPVDLSFRLHPVRTPVGLAWVPRTAIALRRIARRVGADLLHANSTRAAFPAVLASRTGGPATLAHVRDWVPPGSLGAKTLGVVERLADHVVANSRFIARQFPSGGAAVDVVHNAIDPDRFDPAKIDPDAARAELGLGPADTAIGVVAHFTPWKAQDDAVRIFAELHGRYPDLRLFLVGSAKFTDPGGRYDTVAFRAEVESLARSLGVAERVVFLGERADVRPVLAALDVLLVPSWREAFGRAVIEGMAMGLPVVATSEGGPAEVIEDGSTGFVVAPRQPQLWAETVARLLDDPARRGEMGARARERVVDSFSSTAHARRFAEIYAELGAAAASRGGRR